MNRGTIAALAGTLVVIGGYSYVLNKPVAPVAITSPAPVATSAKAGPSDIYPTVPGAINPDVSQATISQNICNPNWSTKSIRPPASYTTALKVKQLAAYGWKDQNTKDYEEDHLISLELGGSPTDPNNLWPEPYTASIPKGGAKTKDLVENALHKEICAGSLTLLQAQHIITTDWYAYALSKNL